VSVDSRQAVVQVHVLDRGDPRVAAALDVLATLRDQLDRAELEARYRAACDEGYQLAAVFASDACVAVAGFRVSTNLYLGRNLYVDDLVTSPAERSSGYGHLLHQWLVDHATAAGCAVLHLDSGTQRTAAHRFYLREGHVISAFHFLRPLGSASPA
jgi:GNAT superfamily N-acetyltransferase